MNKQSLILYITLAILFLNTTFSFGQCVVCVDAPPLITCGETATLTGDGFLTSIYEDNFNSGIGALWSSVSTGGSTTSPCTGASSATTINCAGAGAVPAGDFLWWGQGAAVPRQAITIPIPVPAGGDVIFEFKMEGQGGSCDGPDLIGEGTMLQYRVGAGIWQDMPATMWPFNLNPIPYTNKAYFCPTNPALQSFTSWNQYSIPIPAAAFSANTQFRWRQISPTNANWDFWGLDNVNISPSSPGGATYTWTTPTGPIVGQTLTVNPTSLTNYTFTYDNNGISCSTAVIVDVAAPIVYPVIVPNPLNPCPNAVDLTANVSFNSCNYNIYLYDNGGDGWTTVPQTPTSIDNRIQVYVDGILVNTITMNNGYGPFVYSFPVTSGGTFETVFLTGGPNPSECAYFVEDNQGQLIIDPTSPLAYPNNAISAMGLTTSPSSPFWPVPGVIPPSPGFAVVPGNFGPVNTVCPTTNPYTYSWSIDPSGSTAGISTPNQQSTLVTTASTQSYEVVATDVNEPGCIATGTVQVTGSGGSWDFTNISPNPACEGACIDLAFTSSVSSGNYDITIEMIDATGANSYIFTINSAGNNIATGVPIELCPTISAAIPNVSFNILSLVDASDPNNCEIPITNASQVVTFATQPNAGAITAVDFCANDLTNYDLSTYLGAADPGGFWNGPGILQTPGLNLNFDPQISTAGVYTYTVDNVPCASDWATVTVGLITPPNAGATTNQPYCQNALAVDLATLLGAPDPNGIWVDPFLNPSNPPLGTATFNFNPASDPPGTYTYTVTDASGTCPDESADVNVSINALPTVGISSTNTNICLGQSTCLDFALTGAPNFSIDIWDGASSSTIIVDANGLDVLGNCISVSPTTTTIYSITTITDNNGCQSSPNTAVAINVNNPPNAGVSAVLNICSDDISIYALQNELGGGQELTGYWLVPFLPNPLPNNPNFDYNPQTMIAGVYTYTVVAAPCPDAIANVTVSLIPAPNAGTANNQPICINDYSAINPYDLNNMLIGADGSGFWCAGSVGGAPIAYLIDPNTYGAGTFQFTYQVTGIPPCLDDETTVTLTINPEPVVNTFTSNIPTVSQSYPISLIVDMAVGTPPFTINLVDDDAPSNPYAISIPSPNMNGTVSAVPNVIPVTTYSITGITDGNGCTTTSVLTVPVTVDPYPIIDPFNTATSAVCEGTIPSVNMTLTQGEAPVTVDYSYNGTTYTEIIGIVGSVAPITVNIPLDIANLNNGTNTITIISVTDNSGVPPPNNLIPNPIIITVNPNPVVTFGQDDEICFGQPAILEFGFLVGAAPFTVDYTINGPSQTPLSFNANGMQTHILTPDPAVGVNTYNMIQVTDVNGCQSVINGTNPVIITVNPTPVLDITVSGANPICVGQTSALFFPVTSGTPPYNLSYLAGTTSSTANVDAVGNLVTGTTQPISPIITTTYTLVSVTDAKGCVNTLSSSAQLVVNELPIVDISGTTEICDQDVTQLYFNFTAGNSPWVVDYDFNGTPTSVILSNSTDSIAVSPTITTVYTVTSVSDINCSSPIIDAATITVNPLPEVVVSGGGSTCNDGSTVDVIFNTSSGTPTFNFEYTVGVNNKIVSNVGYQHVISTNEAGTYIVTNIVDSKGCIGQSIIGSADVNINPIPEANIIAYPQPADITNPLIYFVDQSLFHVSGVWDFGDGNTALSNFDKITHTFGDTGTYIVALEVMTDSGCVVTAYQTIIIDPAFIIYIPTAFTPNNDLFNDYFLPIVDGINEYEFSIYDRFGNRVFNTDKTNEAWDGKTNNGTEYATAGTYVYNIIIIDFRGKERTYQGGITLIR
jgi:gliding motility-associated-like protein